MKYIRRIALLFIILLLGGLLVYVRFYQIRGYLNQNKLILTVEEPLKRDKVSIVWHPETGNSTLIFFHGEDSKREYNEYGSNLFKVYYDDTYIGNYKHFKTRSWAGHTYNVRVRPSGDSLLVDCIITERNL